MENDDWQIVSNKKTKKKLWKELKKECPHIIVPTRARKISEKINIENLDTKLMSEEWINHQKNGWFYERVYKPEDFDQIPTETERVEYSILQVENSYGDVVLFSRYKQII